MCRRRLIHPVVLAAALAAALGAEACKNLVFHGFDLWKVNLSGEWDFTLAVPGDEAGFCTVVGALQLTHDDTTLTGSSTVYYRFCGVDSSGTLAEGRIANDTVYFRTPGCRFKGTLNRSDSLLGTAECDYTSGTWAAGRVHSAARLVLSPGDHAMVVGATQAYAARLEDVDHHVLYGREVTWTSSALGVAAVSPTGVVTALAPGSATITAVAGGQTASVQVLVSSATFAAVVPGRYHTCALTSAGAAYCWGSNGSGESGDGAFVQSNFPVPVVGGHTWASLSAGSGFTCGVTTAGQAYCWGADFQGQLGNGDTAATATPVAVAGGHTFTEVSAGTWHACGIAPDGNAWCWGLNSSGQLGDSTRTSSRTPVAVFPARDRIFTHISASETHTCALTTAGAAWCWGMGASGRLGTGDTVSTPAPRPVNQALTFTSVGTGRLHTCALATTGDAYCWGGGVYGQLGNGSRAAVSSPSLVAGGRTYVSLGVGYNHNSALTAAGAVWGWGSNSVGESGDTTRTEWDVPALLGGSLVFAQVAAGGMHSCGITTGGVLYCWGYNSHGQIGDGTRTDRRSPVRVSGQP